MKKKIMSVIGICAITLSNVAFSLSFAAPVEASQNEPKMNICHRTGSENNPWEAIEIASSSWATHQGHGDYLYAGPLANNGKPSNDGDAWCENSIPGAKLIVKKIVINDDGGTKSPSDFTLMSSAGAPASFPGNEDGTDVIIPVAGGTVSYSVTEAAAAGYTTTYSQDCSGTISSGESKTCIVTNNDIAVEVVTNTCPLPHSLGSTSVNNILESGEKSLQSILNDSGYSLSTTTDQTSYQVWNVGAGQEVTVSPEFLDKYAGYSSVFGYYKNGDLSTFTPIFKKGDVAGYTGVPEASVGSTYSVSTSTANTIGFAIKAFDGTLIHTFATQNSLNAGGNDHAVVFNPASNEYVLAFEDLIGGGDNDYNDMVVSVSLSCTELPPQEPQVCSIYSDANTKVIEIKIADGEPSTVDQASMLVSSTTITDQYWTADVDGDESNAKWIWSEDPVLDWSTNKWVTFSKTFEITETGASGTLTLAADNYYEVYLDGNLIGTDTSTSFNTPSGIQIAIPYLSVGDHTLKVVVQNLELSGEAVNNPGGLLFNLSINAESCEDGGNGGGEENTAPTITLKGDAEMTFIIGQSYVEPGAIGTDAEDGTVEYPAVTAGFYVSTLLQSAPFLTTGSYDITYQFCDLQNLCSPVITRKINVVAGTTQCSDGINNDSDQFIDSQDPGCHTDGNSGNTGSYDPNDNTEADNDGGGGTDVCPNIPDNQPTVPTGMHLEGENCVNDGGSGGETDVCPNIADIQTTVPAGMHLEGENCVNDGGSGGDTDVCANIDGIQTAVPEGMYAEGGNCHVEGIGGGDGELDLCANIAGIQTTVPEGTTLVGNACHDNNGGSNGGSGGGGGGSSSGSRRSSSGGGSGSTGGLVLGASTGCGLYLADYIKFGEMNDPEEVNKLQSFLNEWMGAQIPVTGVYDIQTMEAVNKFQVTYGVEVLEPWVRIGLHNDIFTPTGYVYKTTKRMINNLMCPSLELPIPDLSEDLLRSY